MAELQRVKGRLKKKYRDACKKKKSGIFKFVALELLSFHHWMPVPGAVWIALGAWKCSFVWSWVLWEEPCRNCCLFHLQLYAWNYLRFNQMLLVTGCTHEISRKGFYCGTEQGLKPGLESLLCSILLWWSHSERSWCGSWIPVLGLPWFGVEAEGGQDLAGLSLSSLQWLEKCMCSRPSPEQRCNSLLASGMSWTNNNFVDFGENPVLLPEPGKREERQEWEIQV